MRSGRKNVPYEFAVLVSLLLGYTHVHERESVENGRGDGVLQKEHELVHLWGAEEAECRGCDGAGRRVAVEEADRDEGRTKEREERKKNKERAMHSEIIVT